MYSIWLISRDDTKGSIHVFEKNNSVVFWVGCPKAIWSSLEHLPIITTLDCKAAAAFKNLMAFQGNPAERHSQGRCRKAVWKDLRDRFAPFLSRKGGQSLLNWHRGMPQAVSYGYLGGTLPWVPHVLRGCWVLWSKPRPQPPTTSTNHIQWQTFTHTLTHTHSTQPIHNQTHIHNGYKCWCHHCYVNFGLVFL